MPIGSLFLAGSDALAVLPGTYDLPLVALSLCVAVLAGVMAIQLAGMARAESRGMQRQVFLVSGAFVLGSGVWSMHFIGMLAFSVCSTARYDNLITVVSMLPSFLASWVALVLLAKKRITRTQLAISGVLVGAGIGVMHYSGMAAVHESFALRFDPVIFALSIVVAVVLSVLALWVRFILSERGRLPTLWVNLASGTVLGAAITAMHYTGMRATYFLEVLGGNLVPVSNAGLALSIAVITSLAILVTAGGNLLLRYRFMYLRMEQNEARMRTIVDTAVDGIITIDSAGIVRAFNGAAESIFGWSADEVVGRNIRMLMPEPQRSQHDGYLQHYLQTGVAKIIGSGREVVGMRKDGSLFPLRLAIGKAALQHETVFVGFITDLTETRRRNAEFEGVVNAIGRSLAVIEFDLAGTIVDVNQNYLALTGYAREELLGRHHGVLCDPVEVASDAYRQFWRSLAEGTPESGEFQRFGKSGKPLWIYGSYNPILDLHGRPYKIIKFANDLTERHTMEQDLREAKQRAEQAAEAKNTFLANMSHEIRTPMNAIIGFTEVLLADSPSDAQRRHLGTVRNSARSLLGLLNDILDTAKLEHGSVELELRNFSLRELCMHVLATLRVNALSKSLPLVLDYPDDAPEYFRGDAMRIQQVLLNLVGNAIKFTESGRVSLEVRSNPTGMHLVVRDTGIGIPADRLAAIFDPFAQADASMSRRFGGTGLGTTIARQLVELMQGRIWVESQQGVGSQFHVELPLEVGDAVAPELEQGVVALPPLHILVADDVPQNLELLQLVLGPQGHRLVTASNGREAVDAFVQQRFDLVLMDVQMPVLNGLEACREIRRFEAEQDRVPTPVIALTASVLAADIREAQAAGMSGFASKPVDLPRLSQEIARLLQLETAPSEPRGVRPVSVRGSVIDWDKGRYLWGSEARHQDAIRRFLADIHGAVPRLRQLQDAPAELAGQLHRIKGAAANLALSRIAHLGGETESALAGGQRQDVSNLLDQLADELAHVADALAQITGMDAGPVHTPLAQPPDPALLRPTLQQLDEGLAHGELREDALAALARLVEPGALSALDAAVNAFDFDTARTLLADIHHRYLSRENPP